MMYTGAVQQWTSSHHSDSTFHFHLSRRSVIDQDVCWDVQSGYQSLAAAPSLDSKPQLAIDEHLRVQLPIKPLLMELEFFFF